MSITSKRRPLGAAPNATAGKARRANKLQSKINAASTRPVKTKADPGRASGASGESRPSKPDRIKSITLVNKVRMGRDTGDDGVVLQLAVKSHRGSSWLVQIKPADLLSPERVLRDVINETALFPQDAAALTRSINELRDRDAPEVVETVISGWKRRGGSALGEFVLPGRTLRTAGKPQHVLPLHRLTSPSTAKSLGARRGTLSSWKRTNARLLGYSSIGVAALGAAMSAQLLSLAGLPESMAILLAGNTSRGKTTLQLGVMSFQGKGAPEFIHSPDVTARAGLEVCANHNDLMLVIDDLGRLKPREQRDLLRTITYGIVSGNARTVSLRMQAQGWPTVNSRTVVLTSSERGSSQIAELAGDDRNAGEEVRMFDLFVAPEDEGGVFDQSPPEIQTAHIAEQLQQASGQDYGEALEVWLRWLMSRGEAELKAKIAILTSEFVEQSEEAMGRHAPGAARRVIRKFGLIYAALRLGREAGVIPWNKARVRRSLTLCVQRALKADRRDIETLLARLRHELGQPGASLDIKQLKKLRGVDRATHKNWIAVEGLKRKGRRVIALHPPGVRRALGQVDSERLIATLQRRGQLEVAHGKDRWQKRIPGLGRPRLLALDPEALRPDAAPLLRATPA